MSEEQDTEDAELFDSVDSEGGSDAASTSDGDNEEVTTTEESEEAIDLDEDDSTTSAAQQKEKQVDAWLKKIEAGKATFADIPKAQSWVKKELEAKMESKKKEEEVSEELDIDSIVERKLKEKEDNAAFKEMREALNNMKLNANAKKEIKQEYIDLRDAGVPKAVALEKALRISGVALEAPEGKKKFMVAPRASTAPKAIEHDEDNWRETMNEAQRLEKLKAITGLG